MLWIGFSQLHCLPSFELRFKSLEDLVSSRRTDCPTRQWPFFKCVRSPWHLGRCTQSHDPLSPATSKWTRHDKARNSSTERKESSKQPSIPMNPFSWRHMYIHIYMLILTDVDVGNWKKHPSYWSIHSTMWTISRGIFVDQCGRTPSTLTGSPSEATRCCGGKSTIPTSLGKTIGLA